MVNGAWRAHFRAFGTSFAIRSSDRMLMAAARCRARALGWHDSTEDSAALEYALSRVTPCESPGPHAYRLCCNDDVVVSTTDMDALLDTFQDHAKLQTAARASGVLFVHAGAVAWGGKGILIPGRSRAGKSTLVHALLRAGAEYYSDEYAVLDTEGRLHPYPLPLSLRSDGSRPARRIHAEALGAPTARAPAFVDLILATRYRPRARWRPQPLSKGDALLVLLENTVAARQAPARTMPILREAVLRARALRSCRSDAERTARQLLASMS